MKIWKIVAEVRITATRTYYADAESEDEARRLPFEEPEFTLPDDPVQVMETIEGELELLKIQSIEQIS